MITVGARIELTAMSNDPDPIPKGSRGTVTFVTEMKYGRERWTQIGVKWDSGRTLALIVPPDQFKEIEDGLAT